MSWILEHSAYIAGILSVVLLGFSLFGNTRKKNGKWGLTGTGYVAGVILVLFALFVIGAIWQPDKSTILSYSAFIAGILSVILLGFSLFVKTKNEDGSLTEIGYVAIVILVLFGLFAAGATTQTAEKMENIISNLDTASVRTDTMLIDLDKVRENVNDLEGHIRQSLRESEDSLKKHVDGHIKSVKTDVGKVQNTVDSVKTDVGKVQNTVDSVKTDVGKVQNTVDSVKTDVGKVQNTVDSVKTDVGKVQNTVDSVKTDVGKVQNTVDSVKTDVGKVQNTVDSVKTDVGKVQNTVDSVKTDVGTVRDSVDSVRGRLEVFHKILRDSVRFWVQPPDSTK